MSTSTFRSDSRGTNAPLPSLPHGEETDALKPRRWGCRGFLAWSSGGRGRVVRAVVRARGPAPAVLVELRADAAEFPVGHVELLPELVQLGLEAVELHLPGQEHRQRPGASLTSHTPKIGSYTSSNGVAVRWLKASITPSTEPVSSWSSWRCSSRQTMTSEGCECVATSGSSRVGITYRRVNADRPPSGIRRTADGLPGAGLLRAGPAVDQSTSIVRPSTSSSRRRR